MVVCDVVFALPRALVSQNKRRFQEGGFDLDLTYVHPRIIVMGACSGGVPGWRGKARSLTACAMAGYPSSGLESVYRNPRSEVVRLLEARHASRYVVYNFCDERNRWSGQVGRCASIPGDGVLTRMCLLSAHL
jgi:phosphatidylinositol-3,4,5-trisphosphate 3-phosphatase/dual-specificity protein phosphatase PTEN